MFEWKGRDQSFALLKPCGSQTLPIQLLWLLLSWKTERFRPVEFNIWQQAREDEKLPSWSNESDIQMHVLAELCDVKLLSSDTAHMEIYTVISGKQGQTPDMILLRGNEVMPLVL